MQRATVLQIEDDPLWTRWVAEQIAAWPEFQFLGTAGTGAEGIARCRRHRPDILSLDLRLPDVAGIELLDRITMLDSPPRVLLHTAKADGAVLARACQPPVAGLLWKTPNGAADLRQALVAIKQGRTFYSNDVQAALRRFHSNADSYVNLLTATERALLPLLANGFTDKETAAMRGCKVSTVHAHRKAVMAKLNLHSTVDLIRWAQANGINDPPQVAAPGIQSWTEPPRTKRRLP